MTLDHERFAVYSKALEFVRLASTLEGNSNRGSGHLYDQLRRASTSICLNIAEGAGEFSESEKARFYRMAKRSATECAAVLDIFGVLGLAGATELDKGRACLVDIVSMLVGLVKSIKDRNGR